MIKYFTRAFQIFNVLNVKTSSIENLYSNLESLRKCSYSSCINPHSFFLALTDSQYRASLINSDYILIDGIGYALYQSVKKGRMIKRQTGNDTIHKLLSLKRENAEVALIGGNNGSCEIVASELKKKYRASIVYKFEPPILEKFEEVFVEKLASSLISSQANIVLIGLGAPKQEILSRLLKEHLSRHDIYIQGVGAYFDYVSGKVPMPPKVISNFGLEWLYRNIFSFSRTWRRTVFSIPTFILFATMDLIFNRRELRK